MNSKEEKEQKSVLLLVAEDFDKIDDFDPKNYQNRKHLIKKKILLILMKK